MTNSGVNLAKEYHEETKHSPSSVRWAGQLDLENKPLPYKLYTDLPPIELPRDFPQPTRNAIDCVSSLDVDGGTVDIRTLAELLYFSAGITYTIRAPSGEVYDFRAAACTGARYEVESYVVCGDLRGLRAGVYHFNPRDFALSQLRAGDFRPFLYRAAGEEERVGTSPVSILLSAIYWRNSWKYAARAYRHFFWDSGTILANLLATAISTRLHAEVILGFVDESVNNLLGLNVNEEATTAIVPLGTATGTESSPNMPSDTVASVSHEYLPLSKKQVDYPEITKMHYSSSLNSPQEVKAWRRHLTIKSEQKEVGEVYGLAAAESFTALPLNETITRRGSTRKFARKPITLSLLSSILRSSTAGIPVDFLTPKGSTLVEAYWIINNVEGLPTGAYWYDRGTRTLAVLKLGDFRKTAEYLCLEQPLASDGSAVAFLMSNLDQILSAYGNRGYRAAQLEAGIILGKMNLCAYALGIGATGITFYDDAITDFFSPHAQGKNNMVSVVLGIPAYGKKLEDKNRQ